jgi:hypothetical protein
MYRTEEKLKYVDYNKYMNVMGESECKQCDNNNNNNNNNNTGDNNKNSSYNPTKSATETIGFIPTNRNYNYQDVGSENNLLFGTVNREKKEIIESEMPRLNRVEGFGSIGSNSFESNNAPSSTGLSDTTTTFYDGSNDVMRGIMQEYNRVKDKGEFYTFKSTHRRKNIDLSSYMSPPDKVLGRGFGNPEVYEKIYLGEQTRMNDWRPIEGSAPRINDVPYYLTALPVFKDLGGVDTRYLNMKIRN